MAKVVYASLRGAKPGKASAKPTGAAKTVAARDGTESGRSKASAKAGVAAKKVTTRDGKRVTVYTVDADSPTFSADLTAVFRRNVATARRDNKRKLGAADRATART